MKKHHYQGQSLTILQLYELPECEVELSDLWESLNNGINADIEITKESIKIIKTKKVISEIIPEKQKTNNSYSKEQMIEMMSKPVHPMKCVYTLGIARLNKMIKFYGGI